MSGRDEVLKLVKLLVEAAARQGVRVTPVYSLLANNSLNATTDFDEAADEAADMANVLRARRERGQAKRP